VRLPPAGLFIFIAASLNFEAAPFNIRLDIRAITRIGSARAGRIFAGTRMGFVEAKASPAWTRG
jgi:hypothetical protein